MSAFFVRCLALILCISVAFQAVEPAAAVIYKLNDKGQRVENGSFDTAFVINETVDGIQFVVDDAKSVNKLTLKYRTYEVEYAPSEDIDFLRGERQQGLNDAKAGDSYAKAVRSARVAWVQEQAAVRAAQQYIAAKRADDALMIIAELEKSAPRSVYLHDVISLRGQALRAKGDVAGASKAFTQLIGMAKEWGDEAALMGAQGQAQVQAEDKKFAEAAETLKSVATHVDKLRTPEQYAELGFDLATYQRAAGKNPEAIATLQGIAYLPVAGALQGRIHLQWAQILADGPDLTGAFDQAALAASMTGVEETTRSTAKALATQIVDKLPVADKTTHKPLLAKF